jgi:hypothetical protein
VLPLEVFTFLDQNAYKEVGATARTDYRSVWQGNFETIWAKEEGAALLLILKAIKDAN